jgi:hypothetical protein
MIWLSHVFTKSASQDPWPSTPRMGLISSSRGITALVPVEVSMNFGLFQHPADLQLDQNIAETSERSVAPWQRVSRPSRIWCA